MTSSLQLRATHATQATNKKPKEIEIKERINHKCKQQQPVDECEGRNSFRQFMNAAMMHLCKKKLIIHVTTQRNNYHLSERPHVPRRPCYTSAH